MGSKQNTSKPCSKARLRPWGKAPRVSVQMERAASAAETRTPPPHHRDGSEAQMANKSTNLFVFLCVSSTRPGSQGTTQEFPGTVRTESVTSSLHGALAKYFGYYMAMHAFQFFEKLVRV